MAASKNEEVLISTEFITLGQMLKYKGIIAMGNEAKIFLSNNDVLVNGQKDIRRGRKLYPGDTISIQGVIYTIKK